MHEIVEFPDDGTWRGTPAIPPGLPGTEGIGIDSRLVVEASEESTAGIDEPEPNAEVSPTAMAAGAAAVELASPEPPVDGGSGGDVPPPDGPLTPEAAGDAPRPFGVERFDVAEYAEDTPADAAKHAEKTAAILAAQEPFVDTYDTQDGERSMVALEHRSDEGTTYVKVTSASEIRISFVPAEPGATGSSHMYRADQDGAMRRYDEFAIPGHQTAAEQLAGDDLVLSAAMPEGKVVSETEMGYVHEMAEAAGPTRVAFPELVDAILLGDRPADGRLVEESIAGASRVVADFERAASEMVAEPAQRFSEVSAEKVGDRSDTRYGRTALDSDGNLTTAYVGVARHGEKVIGAALSLVTEQASAGQLPDKPVAMWNAVASGANRPYDFPHCSINAFTAFGRTRPYIACDVEWSNGDQSVKSRYNMSAVAARMLRNHMRLV
jgi:hypothetical protein